MTSTWRLVCVWRRYNGVLRGTRSDVPFLKGAMIKLCCPAAVADKYAAGSITLDEAERSLNKYTTTLHGEAAPPPRAHTQPVTPSHALSPGINSAIIKLGKLTVANKCYRGSMLPARLPTSRHRPSLWRAS